MHKFSSILNPIPIAISYTVRLSVSVQSGNRVHQLSGGIYFDTWKWCKIQLSLHLNSHRGNSKKDEDTILQIMNIDKQINTWQDINQHDEKENHHNLGLPGVQGIICVASLNHLLFFSFRMVLCVAGKGGYINYFAHSGAQSLGASNTWQKGAIRF